ncbi:hypothetical protein G6011_03909 [Alternaria panax]|uniref:HTH psq-type domain-containing protein n=1 Tax=Alternaria panax TaxID=48097 RepID=A0AAD4IG50_9PLEO|nr:hypothetical protein G6011_03909 [Alternaria panax]
MNPIQEAIAEIESRDPGEQFSYQQIAKKYGVNRVTLMRRHKHETEDYGNAKLSLYDILKRLPNDVCYLQEQ